MSPRERTTKRKAKPAARPTRPARSAPKPARTPQAPAIVPEHDPLADARLHPLVERYATLTGAEVRRVATNLIELEIAEDDRGFFDGRDTLLVAFSVPALEASPEAEMAVAGSPFLERLLAAVRSRGGRYVMRALPVTLDPGEGTSLAVPVRDGHAERPKLGLERHPVGQLLARVVIRAGAMLEEHLVEGGMFDLATGAPLPRYAGEHAASALRSPSRGRAAVAGREAKALDAKPLADLLDVMLADLRARLGSRLEQLGREAERSLAAELARIDGYYKSMLEDAGARATEEAAAEAARAIEVEHARRRLEEERRHQVRAVVHPLQLVEMEMLVQRAEWPLEAAKGATASISARRYLHGAAHWNLVCPSCARVPEELVVGADAVRCGGCEPRPVVEEPPPTDPTP